MMNHQHESPSTTPTTQAVAMKTSKEIVDQCNQLATLFYRMQGYVVPGGFRFWKSSNARQSNAWMLAVTAYEFIEHISVEDAVDDLGDDDDLEAKE